MSKLKKAISKVLHKTKVDTIMVNPWKEIPHDHDWLPANDGKELVCGLCGLRQNV